MNKLILACALALFGCDMKTEEQIQRENRDRQSQYMDRNPDLFASIIPITSDMALAERQVVQSLNSHRQLSSVQRSELLKQLTALEAAKRAQAVVINRSEGQ